MGEQQQQEEENDDAPMLAGKILFDSSCPPQDRRLRIPTLMAVVALLWLVTHRNFSGIPTDDGSNAGGSSCAEEVLELRVPKNSDCAWWIPTENRKVVLLGEHFRKWRDLYPEHSPSPWTVRDAQGNGLTAYWSATLDYALEQAGFEVVVQQDMEHLDEELLATAHRIVVASPDVWIPSLMEKHEGICKMRTLFWAGNWRARSDREEGWNVWNPQQVWTAYPESYNTFVGFFPHSLLWSDMDFATNERKLKHGMILSHDTCRVKEHKELFQRFMDDGFTLHTTACGGSDADDECCSELWDDNERFVRHGKMSLREFVLQMPFMSFLLGLGEELLSPLVLEALARGVPFLNPYVSGSQADDSALRIFPLQPPVYRPLGDFQESILQHDALAMTGFPYVYNVRLEDTDQVLRAARNAHQYPFASFVPWEFHPQSMVERVCDMLETNAMCDCPNPVFGERVMESLSKEEGEKDEVDARIDCHANSYVRL